MSAPRNYDWILEPNGLGNYTYDQIQTALLMDIRAELRALNRTLNCANCLAIPELLRAIKRNTTKPKRRRK